MDVKTLFIWMVLQMALLYANETQLKLFFRLTTREESQIEFLDKQTVCNIQMRRLHVVTGHPSGSTQV